MKRSAVALVAREDRSRTLVAKYLRDAGYDVFECEDLAIVTRFVGVVIIEDDIRESMHVHVQSWLRLGKSPRVVVISSKPASWKALSLAHSDHLYVFAAPAFSWPTPRPRATSFAAASTASS